jgi:3-hydroxyacyl-[acyl-carrier-protein] dehydratase
MILTPNQVLELLPQQDPFRFVEKILSVDENKITGLHTFKGNEDFYRGHFPQKAITPGVILTEAMCQVGVVGLGIYLIGLESQSIEQVKKELTLFTDATLEFYSAVMPPKTVWIHGEKIFWRRKKLRAKVEMREDNENGKTIATMIASGMGVQV